MAEATTPPVRTTHAVSIDSELVRRNREICQVRVQLRQSETQVTEWKGRHSELVSKINDMDGELTALRRVAQQQQQREDTTDASAATLQSEVPLASRPALADAQASIEALEGRLAEEIQACHAQRAALEAVAEKRTRTLEQQLSDERRAFATKRAAMEADKKERIGHLEMKFDLERHAWLSERCALEARAEASSAAGQGGVKREELMALVTKCAHLEEELLGTAEASCMEIRERFAQERNTFAEQQVVLEESVASAEQAEQLAEARQRVAASERDEALVCLRLASSELRAERKAAALVESELQAEVGARSAEAGQIAQLEARVKILQSENDALRLDSRSLREHVRELSSALQASAQDAEVAKAEAGAQIALLRTQVDEARKARSVTMNAMVKQWCSEGQGGAAVHQPSNRGLVGKRVGGA